MIIWFFFFFAIIAASFVLAYFSMRNFPDALSLEKAGVFLIRAPHNLTKELLEKIRETYSKGEIISFERLFKGNKSALVVFGPRTLTNFQELNLLELEEYANVDPSRITVWEVAVRTDVPENIFQDLPSLNVDDQFWWQLTLRGTKGSFQTEIRAAVLSNEVRRRELASRLQSLADNKLVKQPRPLTSEQLLHNYQKRTITPLAKNQLLLSLDEIFKLLGRV